MLRLIPDWLLYIVVIAVVVFILFRVDQRANAPEALPDATQNGALLPPPSVYDPEILVEVGPQSSGLGTAFAVTPDGWWVTARHVVDACTRVGIIVSRGAAAPPAPAAILSRGILALPRGAPDLAGGRIREREPWRGPTTAEAAAEPGCGGQGVPGAAPGNDRRGSMPARAIL